MVILNKLVVVLVVMSAEISLCLNNTLDRECLNRTVKFRCPRCKRFQDQSVQHREMMYLDRKADNKLVH